MKTGVVEGINSAIILIGGLKYFLGDQKAEGVEKGDTVEFENLDNMWLTHLELIQKGNGNGKTPAAKKTAPATKNGETAPSCKFAPCPDGKNHFVHEKRRNRWECECIGQDNPQLSKCSLEYRRGEKPILPDPELDKKARAAGFGAPPTAPAAEPPSVVGAYVSHDAKGLILNINGKNAGYLADPSVIKYLNSKTSVVKPGMVVTIEVADVPGKGVVAKLIGPGPETTPKETAPAGPQTNPVTATENLDCHGCSPNDKDTDCGYCRELGQEPDHGQQNAMVPHRPQHAMNPVQTWSEDEIVLIRNTIARNCTEPEFKLLMYLAKTYGLDPLAKQIWAVKRNDNSPALIFAGRDGFLAIAHHSGKFDGMRSGVKYEGEGKDRKPVSAWCEIWRKDMSHSFMTEVPFSEYNTGVSVWKTNPSAMILKVAEAVCLRKAFVISGIYSPEEIDTEGGKGRA